MKPPRKIVPAARLAPKLAALKAQGKTIGFTNGCFDLLHAGHVRLLMKARALADVLVVGINSDHSVQRLKGKDRPLTRLQDRLEILAALECVDFVTYFSESTPERLITMLKPDILVKGGDYRREEVVGGDFVEERGGKVVILPLIPGRSTRNLVEKIRSRGRS